MDNLPEQFGLTGLVWQGTTREFSTDRGWNSIIHYKGDHADIEAEAETLAAQGYSLSTEPITGTPKSLLHVNMGGVLFSHAGPPTFPNPDVPLPPVIWTLTATAENVDLRLHKTFRAELAITPTDTLAVVNNYIQGVLTGRISTYGPEPGSPKVQRYVHLVNRGVNSFYTTRWILRKVQIVAPNTSLKHSVTYVLNVFTTEQLKIHESIPATIVFVLPDGEWLKLAGTTEQLQDGRFQFTQEYYYGFEGDWDNTPPYPLYPSAPIVVPPP